MTEGPACVEATTPGRVKIVVETIVPTPNAIKSLTRKVGFKSASLFSKKRKSALFIIF